MTKLFIKWNRDIILLALALAILAFSIITLITKRENTKAVTLVFTHYWEGREEILNTLKNEYEELHDEVKIIINYMPYAVYEKALCDSTSQIWHGVNVLALDAMQVPALMEQQMIEPEIFPILTFFYPLFYNTEILQKNGFNRPPKTRTEFLAQAKEIVDPETGTYAIALALGKDNTRGIIRDIYSWICASGVIAPAESSYLSALEFLAALESEGLTLPGTFLLGEEEKRQAFIAGEIAFMIGTAEDMEMLKASMGASFDYTAVPAPDAYLGKPVFASGAWTLGIPNGVTAGNHSASAHKEEALSFMAFLQEHGQRLAQDWAIPENNSLSAVQDQFYSKARELYISGELAAENPNLELRDTLLRLINNSLTYH